MHSRARKVAGVGFWLVLAVALVHIAAAAVGLANNPATSFPWYAAFLSPGLYYVLPLALMAAAWLVCKSRRREA